jgi:hypothetical protein
MVLQVRMGLFRKYPLLLYEKACVRLLFWSGQTFEEEELKKEGKFKAAEFRCTSADMIDLADLKRWLKKSR